MGILHYFRLSVLYELIGNSLDERAIKVLKNKRRQFFEFEGQPDLLKIWYNCLAEYSPNSKRRRL